MSSVDLSKLRKESYRPKSTNEIVESVNNDSEDFEDVVSIDNSFSDTNVQFVDEYIIIEWKNLIKELKSKSTLNSYVLNSNKSLTSLSKLNNFLKSAPANSDIERLWVIFLWLTHKIEFDVVKVSETKNEKSVDQLLRRGKMNGLGYCKIFKKLCELNNIECILIYGYAKGFGYKVLRKFVNTNHIWVSVKINNDWKLIDVAWAAGYCTEYIEFVQEFQPYYFFTPPEIFIFQHYSEKYQLQENKLTLEQFTQMPLLRIDYFLYEIHFLNYSSLNFVKKNPFIAEFKALSDIKLAADLCERNGKIIDNSILTQQNYKTHNHEVTIHVPRLNDYFIRVYACRENDENFKWVGDFAIQLDDSLHINFFQWCQSFTVPNKYVYLMCPKKQLLRTHESIEYKIYVRNAISVILIDELTNIKRLELSESEKDIWCTQYCNKTKGELKLSAKFENNGPFFTAFSYTFI